MRPYRKPHNGYAFIASKFRSAVQYEAGAQCVRCVSSRGGWDGQAPRLRVATASAPSRLSMPTSARMPAMSASVRASCVGLGVEGAGVEGIAVARGVADLGVEGVDGVGVADGVGSGEGVGATGGVAVGGFTT